MPIQVSVTEAKTKLSQLAEQVWAGETVIIARHGEPYLELRPFTTPQHPRTPEPCRQGPHGG